MISSGANEQQQRQLIAKVIQYEGHLNAVLDKEPLIFSQITKVFNIPEGQNVNDSLFKLKERLINICLQEKEEYLEYLSLPKFRQVSQHALELLKSALKEISERIKVEQENARFNTLVSGIERFIPKMSSIAEMENYHLSVFQLYSKSSICPIGAIERGHELRKSEKELLDEIKPHWNFMNSPYSNFVKSNPQEINNYEDWRHQHQMNNGVQERSLEIYDSKHMFYSPQVIDYEHEKSLPSSYLVQQNLFEFSHPLVQPSSSSLKQIPLRNSKFIPSSHMIQENSQTFIKKQKHQENSRVNQEISHPLSNFSLSNFSQNRQKTFNAVDPNFKNCVCKGKIQKLGQLQFVCDYCNRRFHAECLRIDKEVEGKKKCPICVSEEVQNDCFELIRPALLNSSVVYSRQNSTPAVIKFTEPLLGEMKKIISKNEHKIYLKLITISKNIQILNQENQNNEKLQDLKTKSKHEIGANEMMNEQSQQEEVEKEESEMIEEEKDNQEKDKNNKSNKTNPTQQSTPTSLQKTSIELTANYISQLLKASSPVLSLNFCFSPRYQGSGSLFELERIICYGIYEVKRKLLPEILYKVTCECRSEAGFDEKKIVELIQKRQFFGKDEEKRMNYEEDQNINVDNSRNDNKLVPFRLLLSKRQIRQVYQSALQQNKQLFPIRFSDCISLSHVFELQNYLQTLYNFSINCKTQEHYNLKRLSPDTDITRCPLCVQKPLSKELNAKQSQNNHGEKRFYLDTKLHTLMNDKQTLEQIVRMYDDANSGEEYDFADVSLQMSCWQDLNIQDKPINYSYTLTKISKQRHLKLQQGNSEEQSEEQVQNTSQKDGSDSMEVEDYLNKRQQQNAIQQQQYQEVHQQPNIIQGPASNGIREEHIGQVNTHDQKNNQVVGQNRYQNEDECQPRNSSFSDEKE